MATYFYEDPEKKVIKKELLSEKAEDIAKSLFIPLRNGKEKPGITSSQIRRFYNEIKSLEKQLSSKQFKVLLPLIKMVKSKVAYASNPARRTGSRITKEFRNFIVNCIDNINDEKDFKAFTLHFEAVMGFFYGKGVKQ